MRDDWENWEELELGGMGIGRNGNWKEWKLGIMEIGRNGKWEMEELRRKLGERARIHIQLSKMLKITSVSLLIPPKAKLAKRPPNQESSCFLYTHESWHNYHRASY